MRRHNRPNGKFLSLRDAEAEYGIPYARLYVWVRDGKLPFLDRDVMGQPILIKRTDLDTFLESNMSAVRS